MYKNLLMIYKKWPTKLISTIRNGNVNITITLHTEIIYIKISATLNFSSMKPQFVKTVNLKYNNNIMIIIHTITS